MLQSRVTLEAPAQAELRPTCAGLAALTPPRRDPRQIGRSIRIASVDVGKGNVDSGIFMWAHAIGQSDAESPAQVG